jgi:cystathionine beta-lyase
MLVRTFVSQGDGVLIQRPVYYPFFGAIEHNHAAIVNNPLLYENGKYHMDWDNLERAVSDPNVKLAILCSPHNPVGRVWSKDELLRFGETCIRHNVLVVSDEIHGDLIYPGNSFTPFATISPEFAEHSIICTAPSKTFNIAGLQTSCLIIPNDDLRARFVNTLTSNGFFGIGTFGMVALQAAYDHGEPWLLQLLDYLQGNIDYLLAYVAEHIPAIHVVRPQGTYLVWLDCRKLRLDKKQLERLMREQARVYLDEGYIFGPEGEGFERINIACPRHLLADALERIKRAVDAIAC